MKILFVDHSYHNITTSSSFFIKLLKENFLVERIVLDPEDPLSRNELLNIDHCEYQGVVLWQIDWYASYFIGLGIKTIVIPMYDGSGELSQEHWKAMKGALFISFSLRLHWKISNAGGNSIYVKYFPSIINNSKDITNILEKRVDKPSVFFWERRPQSEINIQSMCKMFEDKISHLHIHQVSDPKGESSSIPVNTPFRISKSSWFETKQQYYDAIRSFDIFIAPRYSEGIGMAYLEAMGMGRVVVAHDNSTHDEYIHNWYNGILVDFSKDMKLDISERKLDFMSYNSTNDSLRHRKNWKEYYAPMMMERVSQYFETQELAPHFRKKGAAYSDLYFALDNLSNAHEDWEKYYSFLQSIDDPTNVFLAGKKYSKMVEINQLFVNGEVEEALELLSQLANKYGDESPYASFFKMALQRYDHRLMQK